MITISKILVPFQGSTGFVWAAGMSSLLASLAQAELIFLNVGDPNQRTALQKNVDAQAAASRQRVVALAGDPATQIVQFARDEGVDLIVMPTHSSGPFRRFLLGSVTAKVLHDADCAVLTSVHREGSLAAVPKRISQIVCGVDAKPEFLKLYCWALGFAKLTGARLKAVHGVSAADQTSDSPAEVQICEYVFERAREAFARYSASATFRPEIELDGGDPAVVIREAALVEKADLIVIGRGHTQSGFGRLWTHTYNIIRHAPCPVVSV